MLASCGFTGASLFFQWTWHTPEVPREETPLILWEGIDGTRLPTLPRNSLNVHQWPEDFDGLLESPLARAGGSAVVQWLELMPSRDWMCRSEVLLPRLKQLVKDKRFDIRPRTAAKLIADLARDAARESTQPGAPVRRYTMDDVWHGMTLGKNIDAHPRASDGCERWLLTAESLAATLGLMGRPYASWDVYPTWELEEAWREALAAQHHDNHECEGLCGSIGETSFSRSSQLASVVVHRCVEHLAARAGEGEPARSLVYNPCGFPRTLSIFAEGGASAEVTVPPFGYAMAPADMMQARESRISLGESGGKLTLSGNGLRAIIDRERGVIEQIFSPVFPDGALARPLLELAMNADGRTETFGNVEIAWEDRHGNPHVTIQRAGEAGGEIACTISLDDEEPVLHLQMDLEHLERPDAGMNRGLQTGFAFAIPSPSLTVDTPCAAETVNPRGTFRRKYPAGDWMTSQQWFESIERPFNSRSFVDATGSDGRGVLLCHGWARQFFGGADDFRMLLTAYDAWDENGLEHEVPTDLSIAICPHGPLSHADRVRRSMDLFNGPQYRMGVGIDALLPDRFGPLSVENAPGVVAQSFFRESMKSGEHLPRWAGHELFRASKGACTHPYVLRLVEWNGEPAEVTIKFAGPVAMAARTNLLGEVIGGTPTGGRSTRTAAPGGTGFEANHTGWLKVRKCDPPEWAREAKLLGKPLTWSAVTFTMRPREIATVMADMVLGRKQFRDLDAKREVWATVHKKPASE